MHAGQDRHHSRRERRLGPRERRPAGICRFVPLGHSPHKIRLFPRDASLPLRTLRDPLRAISSPLSSSLSFYLITTLCLSVQGPIPLRPSVLRHRLGCRPRETFTWCRLNSFKQGNANYDTPSYLGWALFLLQRLLSFCIFLSYLHHYGTSRRELDRCEYNGLDGWFVTQTDICTMSRVSEV
jgi:hypothetical protein